MNPACNPNDCDRACLGVGYCMRAAEAQVETDHERLHAEWRRLNFQRCGIVECNCIDECIPF